MSRRRNQAAEQLGFDALLASATRDNLTRQIASECAHLPGKFEEAKPLFHALIERHHAAMFAGDVATIMHLREEADRLARNPTILTPGFWPMGTRQLASSIAPPARLRLRRAASACTLR
jgi:hypothetical protein